MTVPANKIKGAVDLQCNEASRDLPDNFTLTNHPIERVSNIFSFSFPFFSLRLQTMTIFNEEIWNMILYTGRINHNIGNCENMMMMNKDKNNNKDKQFLCWLVI